MLCSFFVSDLKIVYNNYSSSITRGKIILSHNFYGDKINQNYHKLYATN